MQFTTKEDIDAPIEAVFEMLCDFEVFERAAMRRGAEVQRLEKVKEPGLGMGWQAKFDYRGKRRELELEIVEFKRPDGLAVASTSPGMLSRTSFDLMALSKTKTRVNVSLELKPQVLSARLLVQSLKLAKATLSKRFEKRVADYARSMEERHARENGDVQLGPST